MYTSVLLVVNGQDPTPGFVQHHRHQFPSSEFVELDLETAPIGRAGWNLVKICDRFRFTVFLWSTRIQPRKKGPSVYPLLTPAMGREETC